MKKINDYRPAEIYPMSFVEVVITFTRISISTKEATKHPHLRGLKVVQMKGYTLFSRAEKNTSTKYSSPEKLGYFLPNFAQYILWVKGGKIYTYAEPRTIYVRKNIKLACIAIYEIFSRTI